MVFLETFISRSMALIESPRSLKANIARRSSFVSKSAPLPQASQIVELFPHASYRLPVSLPEQGDSIEKVFARSRNQSPLNL